MIGPERKLRDLKIIQLKSEGFHVKKIVRLLKLKNHWIVYRALGKDRRGERFCECGVCNAHRRNKN